MMARCDHEKRINAMACIESVVGEANSEHFFVATQDADMRKRFQEVPGVPVLYGLRNSLFIEQPSWMQKQFVKSKEEKLLYFSESEYLKLHNLDPKDKIPNNPGHGDADETLLRSASTKKRTLGVSQRSQFKRKRAKGPNPLSCKKKKPKHGVLLSHRIRTVATLLVQRRRNDSEKERKLKIQTRQMDLEAKLSSSRADDEAERKIFWP